VLNGAEKLDEQDVNNLSLTSGKNRIIVQNKKDINDKPICLEEKVVMVSALNKTGIDDLKSKIYNSVIDKNIIESSILITNKRHEQALKRALENLEQALTSIDNAMSLDLVALDIMEAWKILGEITGETSGEEIIDAIFTKFCLGK